MKSTCAPIGLLECICSWLLRGSVAAMLLLGGWGTAFAQSSGNACLKVASGINNPACTANDVRIGTMVLVGGAATCKEGDKVTATLAARVESGPARYDVGFWLNTDAGDAKTDTDPVCFRDFLHPVGTATSCDTNSFIGPYWNINANSCGDVYPVGTDPCGNKVTAPCTEGGGTCLISRKLFVDVTFTCHDSDGDGIADISQCTSWANNIDEHASCDDEFDTNPGTGSKCNCGVVPILGLTPECSAADEAACAANNTQCTTFACDPANPGQCLATNLPATTTCVGTSNGGVCDGTDSCDGAGACVDGFQAATTICRASTGQCDVAESCSGTSGACPADGFQPATTACVGTSNGGACDGTDSCDGANNCVDGFLTATTICRPSAGQCDVAESCSGTSGACPANGFQPATTACVGTSNGGACDGTDSCDGANNCVDGFLTATTICRPSTGQCDVAESCSGASGACPADGFQPATTACVGTSNGGACDGTDSCDGANNCVDGFLTATTICRPSAGQCDVAESCSGTSGACPANGFQPATTACVGTSNGGACDGTDSCDGANNCVDGFLTATTVCRPSTGQCDVAESCSGASGACPADGFQPATTACVGTSNGGACDGTDSCDGANNCVDGFQPATTICRPAAGDCDTPESCTGTSGACPADGFLPSTTSCNPDLCQSCSGSGASCGTENLCSPEACRTAGYWAQHAGTEKAGSTNQTSLVIQSVGSISVCGQTINPFLGAGNTGLDHQTAPIEALCAPNGGDYRSQVVFQLTAAKLNCAANGFANCVGDPLFEAAVAACEVASICAPTTKDNKAAQSACVSTLDCLNSGGHPGDGGVCNFTADNCHLRSFADFPDSPAGSENACKAASRNHCTIFGGCAFNP